MKRFLTAFLALTAMTVSLPSCVIALGNTGGTGCPECEHCATDGGVWDENFVYEHEHEDGVEGDED